MPDTPITRAEATVLIDERIKLYDEDTLLPKHRENQTVLKALTAKVDDLRLDIGKMVSAANITMKFAGAGVVIWSIRQFVELAQSFHH